MQQRVAHLSFRVVWAILLLLAVGFDSGLIFHLIFGLELAYTSVCFRGEGSEMEVTNEEVKSEPPPSYKRVATEDLDGLPKYEDVVSVTYV